MSPQLAAATEEGKEKAARAKAAASGFLPAHYADGSASAYEVVNMAPGTPRGGGASGAPDVASAPGGASPGPSRAWMAAREQAEAELRSEIQAVREDVRLGFAQMSKALQELKEAQL